MDPEENVVEFEALLKVISTSKIITINLIQKDTKDKIITFEMPGYEALASSYLTAPIQSIEIVDLKTLNIII